MLRIGRVTAKATAACWLYLSCWNSLSLSTTSRIAVAAFATTPSTSRSSPFSAFYRQSLACTRTFAKMSSSETNQTTAAETTTTTQSSSTAATPPQVNLIELAAAAVSCTVTAARSIRRISGADAKNSRLKTDGSVVTDADFCAQGVIFKAITSVSSQVKIVGEESAEEMARHTEIIIEEDADIRKRTLLELRLRYHGKKMERLPLAQTTETDAERKPLSDADTGEIDQLNDPEDCIVDASRVIVIVDPLDGTKSYATGDYDCVSILIGIVLDNKPFFGVIGKPFGYTGVTSILDTGCATFYGGPMINGVYIAGGDAVIPTAIDASAAIEDLPRAVISSSRSKGLVHDFCIHLGEQGLVYPEPMLISGAGEKSLRLILQRKNEALWFYPKAGTSLWDVAAPDALLRALGGKMSDKFGNDMDYSKNRDEAENIDGVVACIDAKLHEKCIRLFQEGDWGDRIY